MAKIRIHCSECGHEARVPEAFRSRKVRCLRCHAKLRVPEDAPLEASQRQQRPGPTGRGLPDEPRPRAGRTQAEATRGGPSSKTRQQAMSVLRELLHDYDHAIESVPRGYEIDLRGRAFGLARSLAEEMLLCEAIRDVKLAGGTGECRLTVTLQGYAFDPEDSFAEEDEDTEVFQRKDGGQGDDWTPRGILESAVGIDAESDPSWHLDKDAPEPPPESAMQSLFTQEATSGGRRLDPIQLYEEACQRLDDGDPGEAIVLLERAVAADRNFARAVQTLGKAYASAGDFHRARRAFRHLAKLAPNDPETHVLHAAAAVRCERLEDARHALKIAIKLDPEYKQAYRYAAQLYERLGEADKARKFRARYQALKLKG